MSLLARELVYDLGEIEPNFFVSSKTPSSDWMKLNINGHGSTLRDRADIALTTSSLDIEVYRRLLSETLNLLPRACTVLELGAGDGRITHELLKLGFTNIIAVECHPESAKQLYNSLSPTQRKFVQVVCADVLDLNIPENSIDALVSIEVLCYLNKKFEKRLEHFAKALAPNGIITHSELMQEGNLYYAIAFEDKNKIESLLQKKWAKSNVTIRVFTKDEMQYIYKQCGLKMLESHPISSLHGFLSAANHRLGKDDVEVEQALLKAFPLLNGDCMPRAMYFSGKKLNISFKSKDTL
ncbi:methyltransferase domain-containing protein [Maridesulfovibrio sp.]|uniref:class I SAM-dependent methyltransferase n=1 Tax=Maridesulfovibrio sp. TaxID=2795000 RepID=UPI0029CA98EF|nr:methyltransferase domain-containing protein [Maridesulfovibrio sp.]